MIVFRGLVLLLCVVLAGCAARRSVPVGRPPVAMSATVSGSGPVEVLDAKRLEVDVEARTVRLFPIDNGGHWLVILPGKPQEKIQGLEYRVPEDVKLDEVQVYFVIPGVRQSNAVKLAEVKKKM
jgi:hypothetical protein